jgi:tripartite-type tricarboxylate transporter receptor subunit TctC
MARPFAAPPDVPPERTEALRAAFDATMKDPDFLSKAKKLDLEMHPVGGAELEDLVEELYRSPPDVVKLATEAIRSTR